VHGGGFYHNQKYLVAPAELPAHLHWFKYEAYFTWISGFLLLAVIYYAGAGAFLIDSAKLALTVPQAILISLGFLAGAGLSMTGCAAPPGPGRPPVRRGLVCAADGCGLGTDPHLQRRAPSCMSAP